jgi:hypothetical protein
MTKTLNYIIILAVGIVSGIIVTFVNMSSDKIKEVNNNRKLVRFALSCIIGALVATVFLYVWSVMGPSSKGNNTTNSTNSTGPDLEMVMRHIKTGEPNF